MAGTSIDNLVKTVEYVTPDGVDGYRAVGEVRQSVLGRPFPASTGVVVSGLLSRRWLIEVEAIASNRSGTPTLRYPARWPWATQFRATLSALRALPGR